MLLGIVRQATKTNTGPATRRHGDVVTTSLCASQRRCRYISNETSNYVSMERCQDVSCYVSTTSYWNFVTTSQEDITTKSPRRLKQLSNETPNDFSLVLHQDASVVRIHNVPLVRPCDVCCKSQMKQPLTSLWYVSTMSQSYVVVPPCY